MKTLRNQSGRSMIEMLGVLAIIGVLSVGGLAGYSKAMDKYRINETINQIIYMETNIHNLFFTQPNYSDLGVRGLLASTDNISRKLNDKANFIPNSVVKNGYKNLYQGDIGMGYLVAGDTTKSFYIKYFSIPQEACIAIVTHNWGNVEGFVSMRVEGSSDGGSACTYNFECTGRDTARAYAQGIGLFAAKYMPLTPEQAITVCDTDKNNMISFKFR